MGLLDINLQGNPISKDYLLNKKYIIYNTPSLGVLFKTIHIYKESITRTPIVSIIFKYNLYSKKLELIIPKYIYWKDCTEIIELLGANGRISLVNPCSPAKLFYDELQNIGQWISSEVLIFQDVRYENDLELYENVILQKALNYDLNVSNMC